MENYSENNYVEIGGKVNSKLEFSHEIYDEKFYKFFIETKRLSNSVDKLPRIISERLVDIDELEIGKLVNIQGQFRSDNKQNEGKRKIV